MDTPNQIPNPTNPISIKNVKGAINIENVHFAYDNDLKIINGLNLNIPAGTSIGIAGTTGAGKTTLIKLLLPRYIHSLPNRAASTNV